MVLVGASGARPRTHRALRAHVSAVAYELCLLHNLDPAGLAG